MIASSSAEKTDDFRTLGPVGRSETEERFFSLGDRLRVEAVPLGEPLKLS